MDAESIKKKIVEAKEIVKDLDEPFKTESFKILLTKMLDTPSNSHIQSSTSSTKRFESQDDVNIVNPMLKLAQACNISEDQLKNVLDFDGDKFVLLKKINGSTTAEKQINASLCILTAWTKGMNQLWINSVTLGDSLRELSIDVDHLGKNLTRTDYFSLKGKKRAAKYHITTQGWQKGLELLKSMAGD